MTSTNHLSSFIYSIRYSPFEALTHRGRVHARSQSDQSYTRRPPVSRLLEPRSAFATQYPTRIVSYDKFDILSSLSWHSSSSLLHLQTRVYVCGRTRSTKAKKKKRKEKLINLDCFPHVHRAISNPTDQLRISFASNLFLLSLSSILSPFPLFRLQTSILISLPIFSRTRPRASWVILSGWVLLCPFDPLVASRNMRARSTPWQFPAACFFWDWLEIISVCSTQSAPSQCPRAWWPCSTLMVGKPGLDFEPMRLSAGPDLMQFHDIDLLWGSSPG